MKSMLWIFLFGIFCTIGFGQETTVLILVTNPAAFARRSETISVPWKELSSHLLQGTKSVVVSDQSSGKDILSQIFDADIDGMPDALLFQSDFDPKEGKEFILRSSPEPSVLTQSLVDARMVEPREDLAWENDRIAFRMYGPPLAAEVDNGIDVWTKRVRYLIVKKWYEGEEQTPKLVYHVDRGEGADFFNVGRSLGCGSSGIWHNGKLYQGGVFASYRIISTGPLRACFELSYDNWNVDGTKLKETKRITLDAGQNLNTIHVRFIREAGEEPREIACGLVRRKNTTPTSNVENGWMSLWGLINDSSENSSLGTGIVFEPQQYLRVETDSSHYLLIGKTGSQTSFTYYTGAGWTKSGDFQSAEDWNSYLSRWALSLRWPLMVSVSANKGDRK
jgi:pectinesterase